mgnify:CR=1 FL=1|jgi:hypothetical protein
MAIGRISGSVLKSNLVRNGTDLAFETNLLYLDVTNSRVGIGTSEPSTALQVNGTTTTAGLTANGAVNIDGTGTSNMDNVIIGTNTAAAITGTTVNGTVITASTNFAGALTGNVTGNASGTAATVTTAAQPNITSLGTLTTLDVSGSITVGTDETIGSTADGTFIKFAESSSTYSGFDLTLASKQSVHILLDTNSDDSSNVGGFTVRGGADTVDASNEVFKVDESGNLSVAGNTTLTGSLTFSGLSLPTADGNNGQVLQTDGNGTIIFAESGGGGGGNNTAIQQTNYYKLGTSTKVIDEFDLTEYRGAVYDISIDDHVNSLVGHVKVTLLHDGSTPYISIYDVNEDSTNICIFTTAISGTKLQLIAKTNGSTNTDLRLRRVALGDHHETVANTNSKIIATSTAISSSATTLDQFTKTDLQSAKYVVLFKDSTQNEYQMNEVSMVHDGTNVFFNFYGGVSSRADFPFTLSAAISGATVTVSATSTGGTTATAILYRLDLGSKTKFGNFDDTEFKKIHDQDSTVATVDEFDVFKYDTARYFISIANAGDTEYQNSEIVLTTNSAKTGATISESIVRTGTTTLATFTADVSSGKARLRMAGTSANNVVYVARTAVEKELIHYASDHTSNDVFIKANNLLVDDEKTEFKVNEVKQFSNVGFVSRQYVLSGTTTNNTETEIFVGGVTDSRIPVATNSTMNYTLDITARRTDADGYSAGYQLKGVVDNNSGTVADVGDVYEIIIAEDDSGLTIDATADNTNKALKVTVTGQTSHTYKWICVVKTYEVIE